LSTNIKFSINLTIIFSKLKLSFVKIKIEGVNHLRFVTQEYLRPMMISAIPSQPTSASAQCLCSYANTTSSLQVIRIGNPSAYSFERIVFPGDRLLFEAASDAQLEVLSTYLGQAIKIEKIPCHQLQVELNQPRLSA
jgi:hypothetical protein